MDTTVERPLRVTYDSGQSQSLTLSEVLHWQHWSPREQEMLRMVESGLARRFSTSHNGVNCDIELARKEVAA